MEEREVGGIEPELSRRKNPAVFIVRSQIMEWVFAEFWSFRRVVVIVSAQIFLAFMI
jgi:hypothetical protein